MQALGMQVSATGWRAKSLWDGRGDTVDTVDTGDTDRRVLPSCPDALAPLQAPRVCVTVQAPSPSCRDAWACTRRSWSRRLYADHGPWSGVRPTTSSLCPSLGSS
jgi:hypothetical protein